MEHDFIRSAPSDDKMTFNGRQSQKVHLPIGSKWGDPDNGAGGVSAALTWWRPPRPATAPNRTRVAHPSNTGVKELGTPVMGVSGTAIQPSNRPASAAPAHRSHAPGGSRENGNNNEAEQNGQLQVNAARKTPGAFRNKASPAERQTSFNASLRDQILPQDSYQMQLRNTAKYPQTTKMPMKSTQRRTNSAPPARGSATPSATRMDHELYGIKISTNIPASTEEQQVDTHVLLGTSRFMDRNIYELFDTESIHMNRPEVDRETPGPVSQSPMGRATTPAHHSPVARAMTPADLIVQDSRQKGRQAMPASRAGARDDHARLPGKFDTVAPANTVKMAWQTEATSHKSRHNQTTMQQLPNHQVAPQQTQYATTRMKAEAQTNKENKQPVDNFTTASIPNRGYFMISQRAAPNSKRHRNHVKQIELYHKNTRYHGNTPESTGVTKSQIIWDDRNSFNRKSTAKVVGKKINFQNIYQAVQHDARDLRRELFEMGKNLPEAEEKPLTSVPRGQLQQGKRKSSSHGNGSRPIIKKEGVRDDDGGLTVRINYGVRPSPDLLISVNS